MTKPTVIVQSWDARSDTVDSTGICADLHPFRTVLTFPLGGRTNGWAHVICKSPAALLGMDAGPSHLSILAQRYRRYSEPTPRRKKSTKATP